MGIKTLCVKDLKKGEVSPIVVNVTGKKLQIQGNQGLILFSYSGLDIILQEDKVFIKSKMSYKTFISLFKNALNGLINGYYIELELVGVGYRFINLKGKLLIRLGYSDNIIYSLPDNVRIVGYKKNIVLFGILNSEVTLLAELLHKLRLANVYKPKGILIKGEVLKLKIGKRK